MKLYPLKFKPLYKERVWGGNKMASAMNREIVSEKPIGESWELSAVKGDLSVVTNGFLKDNDIEELIEVYMGDLVGDKVYEKFGIEFPLLFKLIDSKERLSVQVHPDDQLSLKRHKAYGKTEMWYVLSADSDAAIYVGFNKSMTKEEYKKRVAEGTLLEVMNKEIPKVGDVFFLPAGRIHAIGEGLLVAEIQQTSDVTYRIYDWGRENNPATAREMHTSLAEDAIDYTFHSEYKTIYQPHSNTEVSLVSCDYFTTNLLELDRKIRRDYSQIDSFVVYMCLEGEALLDCDGERETIKKGETVLIPAVIHETEIIPQTKVKLLEIYIK